MYSNDWQIYGRDGSRKYTDLSEFRRFLRATEGMPPERKAFCFLIAYTGCRISEGLLLRRSCIGLGTVTLVTLKRRKLVFRTLQIPEALSRLLIDLPTHEGDDDRVWTINRSSAYRWTKSVFNRARIRGTQACPRGLRHGFGMRAASERVPAGLIQRWLGHAYPSTTQVYLDAVGIEERMFAARTF
jgi:integrase/recombinase XerD